MAENMLHFSDADFEEKVVKSEKITVVDFWAEWCAPCRMIAPTIQELADEYVGKINIGKLNVDENPKTATKYGIRGIPTLLIFKNGNVHQQIVGVRPKSEIKKILDGIA
ncbi:MAG: thioredoxin [Nitrospinota bacterium]